MERSGEEMRAREVAELLGVTRPRVDAFVRAGRLAPEMRVSEVGTSYRVFRRAEVMALAEERRAEAVGGEKRRRPGPAPRAPRAEGREP